MPGEVSLISAAPANNAAAADSARRFASPDLPPFRFSVIARLGKKYLSIYPALLVLYIAGNLLSQAILPQQATLYLGDITDHFNAPAQPFHPADSALSSKSSDTDATIAAKADT